MTLLSTEAPDGGQGDALPDSNESLPSSGVYTHTRIEEIARMGRIVIILHYYSVPTQQELHSRYQSGLQSEPEMVDLINEVAAVIPWLWYEVGIQLDVPYEDLKGYQERNPSASSSKMFTYVFATWRIEPTNLRVHLGKVDHGTEVTCSFPEQTC